MVHNRKVLIYVLSRRWNTLVYWGIRFLRLLIWDQTGRNEDLKHRLEFGKKYSEDIFTSV